MAKSGAGGTGMTSGEKLLGGVVLDRKSVV